MSIYSSYKKTHSCKETALFWRADWGSKILFDHGNKQSKGVAILLSNKIEFKIHKVLSSNEGRYILAVIEIDSVKYLLANIYAPNKDEPELFLQLFEQILQLEYDHLILGGDLNVHLQAKLDKKGGSGANKVSKKFNCDK